MMKTLVIYNSINIINIIELASFIILDFDQNQQCIPKLASFIILDFYLGQQCIPELASFIILDFYLSQQLNICSRASNLPFYLNFIGVKIIMN